MPIGGLVVRWGRRFSTTHLYDGENVHHLANFALEHGRTLGLVAVEQDDEYYLGVTFSAAFGR